uniref:hypothetical protein n=1 Tax=Horticoccus sp. 23ND18S-11 TaxID=3391832 RepID=UPI0039C98290
MVLLCVLVGCRWSSEYRADIYGDANAAEVIVLADVRKERDRERYFAREVLKGKLGSEFRFRLGEEITPAFDGFLSSGPSVEPVDGVLLFYKQQFGVLSHSGMWSVKSGRILALEGAEGSLSTFISRVKEERK